MHALEHRLHFCFDKMEGLVQGDKITQSAKEENAKQKSWRPKNVTRVRSFSKGWGRKKRWGKEKGDKEVSNRQDKGKKRSPLS
jgi:hypothetical protein